MGELRDLFPCLAEVVEFAFRSVFVGDGAVVQAVEGRESSEGETEGSFVGAGGSGGRAAVEERVARYSKGGEARKELGQGGDKCGCGDDVVREIEGGD